MKSLYGAHVFYTKTLEKQIDRLNDELSDKSSKLEVLAQAIATSRDAPNETLARVQKIQTDLERANAQIVELQGYAKSLQAIAHEQREQLPEIAARLNHLELQVQQALAQLSELRVRIDRADAEPSR